jgi:WD40 repeat protein
VRQAAISPDGKRVGIAGLKGSRGDSDGWLVLWDSTSDQTLQLETGKVTNSCVAFSSDGRFIAASGWNKPTKIWELQNNATYRPIAFLGTKGALNWRTDSVNIAFLPNVRTVIVSRMTEAIEFWGF